MAFYSLNDLVNRTIVRLRQVPGAATQLYSADMIASLIEEEYEACRAIRWWDHLMKWETRQLDGTTGIVTAPFSGARERFRDIQYVFVGTNNVPIPNLSSNANYAKYTGTYPRFIEPLHSSDDPLGVNLFRVIPVTAVTTVDQPLRVRLRSDPANIFTDPGVIVPFDATCLVNGAAAKYMADDGTNPASVAMLLNTRQERMKRLEQQHDTAVIILDDRTLSPLQDEWVEDR